MVCLPKLFLAFSDKNNGGKYEVLQRDSEAQSRVAEGDCGYRPLLSTGGIRKALLE